MTAEHLQFMTEAVAEAHHAEAEGEVPVGAVAVADGQVVGAGHNGLIGLGDPTAHAEILAIRAAASTLRTYRLTTTLICDARAVRDVRRRDAERAHRASHIRRA